MKDCVKDYLSREKTKDFSELLFEFIDNSGLSDILVYKKANIDRKFFSKIKSGERIPSKDVIIRLCFALKLNIEAATSLLASAGFILSSSNKRDLVIKYCLENNIYDYYIINDLLYSLTNTVF